MPTYDFEKDNGQPVTVEFSYSPGSDMTYSPMYGACGGDGCEVYVISSWPRDAGYDYLCGRYNDLSWNRHHALMRPLAWVALQFIKLAMWFREYRARLTVAESDRMADWVAEHHEYEPPEFEDDY